MQYSVNGVSEVELAMLTCPKCYAGAIGPNVRKQNGRFYCKCDICGNQWVSSSCDACGYDKPCIIPQEKHGMTVGAALGLISLIIFIVGLCVSSTAMWVSGLCAFLLLSALSNFE